MLDHIGLSVPDLRAAKAYYDEIMPLLGYEPFFSTDRQFSYRRAGGKPGTYVFFYRADETAEYSRHRPGLQHIAFKVRSRAEVLAAHDRAVSLGSEVVRPPGVYAQYHPDYYAAYWHDPHGFMLEVVCYVPDQSA